MQLSKEDYARKIIHNGCSVRIENSVNQDNYYASLGNLAMPNSYPRDRIFNPHLTDSYCKDTYENVFEHLLHMNMRYMLSVFMLHTKM